MATPEITPRVVDLPADAPKAKPAEVSPPTPDKKKEAEKKEATIATAEELEEMTSGQLAEQLLESKMADEQGENPTETPKKPTETMLTKAADGIAKMGEKAAPMLEKLTAYFTTFTEALTKALAPLIPLLIKLKIPLPEWLLKSAPGMKELQTALADNGRTLISSPDDKKTMRALLSEHKTLERSMKKKKETYTLDQFFEDAVIGLPEDKNKITMEELLISAKKVAQEKKEAAPAAAKPATAPTPTEEVKPPAAS